MWLLQKYCETIPNTKINKIKVSSYIKHAAVSEEKIMIACILQHNKSNGERACFL